MEFIRNVLTFLAVVFGVLLFGEYRGRKKEEKELRNKQNEEALKNVRINKEIEEQNNLLSTDSLRVKLRKWTRNW